MCMAGPNVHLQGGNILAAEDIEPSNHNFVCDIWIESLLTLTFVESKGVWYLLQMK